MLSDYSSLIIFEDEHLLVVNKPAGWNTHAPSPYAGEGIYEWLRHREPRWASLAIIHRLDKETSGVMMFAKSKLANRSLTEQFTNHTIRKTYLLLADAAPKQNEFRIVSALVRAGQKFVSRPLHAGAERAETRFRLVEKQGPRTLIAAEPVTGRTHQIRVHAAESGFPILGDSLYGGATFTRVCLHAAELRLKHPASGEEVKFTAPVDFNANARAALRAAVVDAKATDAWRMVHGAADGWPGWYVERYGDFLLSQAEQPLSEVQTRALAEWLKQFDLKAVYHKTLNRHVRQSNVAQASPQLVLGTAGQGEFEICENGVRFGMSFNEGYSVGLFLDQRDNRRRFLVNHVAADFALFENGGEGREVLNTFAYTCGFSVCAALGGARVTSLDLSKKYLEWGKRNFALNGLDPAAHDFIYGDAFDWMARLAKKQRSFDAIVLDPPTFSQSKEQGAFRVEKDYGKLVKAALALLKSSGVLLASTNAAGWGPEKFVEVVTATVRASGRKILKQHYVPQPPDFPVSADEPAYLKTLWLRVG